MLVEMKTVDAYGLIHHLMDIGVAFSSNCCNVVNLITEYETIQVEFNGTDISAKRGHMTKKIYVMTLMLLIHAFGVHAGNSKESMINDIYKKSGLELQIKQIPNGIHAYLDLHANNGLNKSDLIILKDIATVTFDPVLLEKSMKEHMAKELDENCLKDVLKWLDSPLGKRIAKMEEEGSTAEAMLEVQKYASQLRHSPPSKDRLAIMKEFIDAVHVTDVLSEIVMNSQLAVAVASMMAQPPEKRVPIAEIRRKIEENKPKITLMILNEFIVSSLYQYRDLKDSELREYITFAKSPSGEKYHAVTIEAHKKPIIDYGFKIGEALGKKKGAGTHLEDI